MLSGQSRLLKTQEIAPSNPHFAIEGQQQRMRSREALGEALCKALGEALCGTYAELLAKLSVGLMRSSRRSSLPTSQAIDSHHPKPLSCSQTGLSVDCLRDSLIIRSQISRPAALPLSRLISIKLKAKHTEVSRGVATLTFWRRWLLIPFLRFAGTTLGGRIFVNFLTPVDRWLLRQTAGKYSLSGLGAPTLLLTTRGRKTGRPRSSPLLYLQDQHARETLYVVASKGGDPNYPDWYLNLQQHPVAEILAPTLRGTIHSQDLEEPARSMVWQRFTEFHPGFERYAQRIDRDIPIVALTRIDR